MISLNKKNFAIAIDGPAAAGKSSVARRLAAELGFYMLIQARSIARLATTPTPKALPPTIPKR